MTSVLRSLCLFTLCAFVMQASAQNTCSTPFAFNTGSSYNYALTTGVPNTDSTNNYGCLLTTVNPLWLYVQVCDPGTAILTVSAVGSSGLDVDYVVWGPLSAPTDCGLDTSQVYACSYSVTSLETISFSGLLTGQYYKILITNYSDQPGTLTISQHPGTPGSFDTACPPPGCMGAPQEICMVTTDFVLNKNIIVFEKDTLQPVTGYVIEKESTTLGVFLPLDTLTNADSSAWMDPVSNPLAQAFRYRISVIDTCANYIPGIPHKTIHLQCTPSLLGPGYVNLSWNAYQGFSYGTYFIYRGTSPATMVPYDSIASSSTTYTDVAALPGTSYYAIGIMPDMPCTPTRSLLVATSNASANSYTGVDEISGNKTLVYPNPANTFIQFSTQLTGNATVQLFGLDGQQVLNREFNGVNNGNIPLAQISEGVYILRISTAQGISWNKINVVH